MTVDNLSSFGKSEFMYRIQHTLDLASEAGCSAEDLDEWLDTKQAYDLPDFAWYAVYAVQKMMESLEETED